MSAGLSASVIGTILGGFAVAAALMRVVLPLLAARLREWVVIAVAMGATAVLFAHLSVHADAARDGRVLGAARRRARASVQPMVMSTLHQITPEHRHGEAVAHADDGDQRVQRHHADAVRRWPAP